MNLEGHSEAEVRVCFGLHKLGILYIGFVSLWSSFWNPEGASFGVIGPRRPILRQFWGLKIIPIWGLGRTNGLRVTFGEFKVWKWSVVALALRVYTLFYQAKVAFVNMHDLIHLYKTWVLCAQNAYISVPDTATSQDPDRSCETCCM